MRAAVGRLSNCNILWAVVLCLSFPPPATAQTGNPELEAQEVAELFSPSVVLVQATTGTGSVSSGSGFFVSEDGVLATALHVLDGAESIVVVADGVRYERVSVRGFDVDSDLAVLGIDAATSPVVLGDTSQLEPGGRLYAIGNPLGLTGTISEGLFSAWREPGGDEGGARQAAISLHSLPQVRLLQFSASISPGSSGGPVFDHYGLTVGVVTGAVEQGALDLNFAVPIEHLDPLAAHDQGLTLDVLHDWVDRRRAELADPHVIDARYYYESEMWSEALESAGRALGLHPSNQEALVLNARLLLRSGRFDEAEVALREATEANPDSAEVWAAYGEFLLQHRESRTAEIIRVLERALELDPWRADATFALGLAYAKLGRFGDAQAMWEQTVDIDRDHLNAHLALGQLFLDLNDWGAAERVFRDALGVDRDSEAAHYGLAVVYQEMGDEMRSKQHLQRFRDLGGNIN